MNTYSFTEATPLLQFIEENKTSTIGSTLKYLHTEYWPRYDRESISDRPAILELENLCVARNAERRTKSTLSTAVAC